MEKFIYVLEIEADEQGEADNVVAEMTEGLCGYEPYFDYSMTIKDGNRPIASA